MYTLVTPPTVEPVDLATAKLFLQVEIDDDDAVITSLISSATDTCENICESAFVTRTGKVSLFRFPQYWSDKPIWLPYSPVQSITGIVYVDQTGTQQTLDPSAYEWQGDGLVLPSPNTWFPSARPQIGAVQITYTHGYGLPTDATFPQGVANAVLFLVRHWYETRVPVADVDFKQIPMTVDALLNPYKRTSYP